MHFNNDLKLAHNCLLITGKENSCDALQQLPPDATVPLHDMAESRNNHCPLLELSPELRNIIYRLVLVRDGRIEVSAQSPGTPALLRTCRQIRNEATSIFREENKFGLVVVDLKWRISRKHWAADSTKLGHLGLYLDGEYKWANLLDWVKAAHDGACFGLKTNPDAQHEERNIVAGAFEIASSLRGKVAWTVIATVLETYRMGTDAMIGWS